MRLSPLHRVQERAGARFVEWQGAVWTRDFGDALAEHRHVRTAAGLWDISPLLAWDVRGRHAADAVDRLFSNAVVDTAPGQIRYGLFCDASGAMLNDATVFRLELNHLRVFTSRERDLTLLAATRRTPGVSVEPIGEPLAAVQLQGPRSREVLAPLCPAVVELPFFRFLPEPAPVAGAPCLIARIGFSGELGYELFCPAEHGERLWHALTNAGARPYGFAAVETLRIEAGLLLLDTDFRPGRTNPYDLSLDHVIRLEGRDFVGRDALAATAVDPPRRLVALDLGNQRPPAAGARVLGAGAAVGVMTSSCWSPTLDRSVALASVKREVAPAGTELQVVSSDGPLDAVVRSVPLYDPRRRRLLA